MTARLSGRDGVRAILLRHEAAVGASETSLRPGMVTPTWSTGPGRALLWDHAQAELETLLADVQFVGVGGPGAARSVPEVVALMRRDREGGMVRAEEEYDDGVLELALPIRDAGGGIIAAISVSHPMDERETIGALADTVAEAAAALTGLASRR